MSQLGRLAGALLAVASASAMAQDQGKSPGNQASQRNLVTFRTTSALPDSALELITKLSLPTAASIPPLTRPEDFVRAACGAYTKVFESRLLELNPQLVLAPSERARSIQLPACPRWRLNASVPVRDGDTLALVLLREIGRGPDHVLRVCGEGERSSRCDRPLSTLVQQLNPGIDLTRLKPGTTLTLPLVSEWATFEVKEGAGTAKSVAAAIGHAASAAPGILTTVPVIRSEPSPEALGIIRPVGLDDALIGSQACREAWSHSGAPWPFDAAAVTAALQRATAAAAQRGRVTKMTRIAVVDTGVRGIGIQLPESLFDMNGEERPNNRDDDNNNYIDDIYGANGLRRGDVEPLDSYEWPLHGTYVAYWAAGGPEMRAKNPTLNMLIRLKAVRIVEQSMAGAAEIQEGSLLNGLHYAGRYADIVNLSVSTPTPLGLFVDAVSLSPNLLIVAAAGNDGLHLGDHPVYPANYGGEGRLRGQLLTVAAHDGRGDLASFSNRGPYVDIAAPGCGIPHRNAQDEETRLYGTSFAAPLVSLAAGLLRSLGVEHPAALKRRLMVSVDYDPALGNLVVASGRLNLVKALSLFEDVVETGEGLRFLQWEKPGSITLCDDLTVEANRIRKISRAPSSPDGRIRIVLRDSEDMLRVRECVPVGPGLTFRDGQGSSIDVPWAGIRDFVPRHFF